MNTPTPPTSSNIRSLLSEFDASGQSAAGFARSRGIAVWRLHYALKQRVRSPLPRSREPASATPALIPVHVVDPAPSTTAASLELLLANGHRIRVGRDFDAALLRQLLGALSQC